MNLLELDVALKYCERKMDIMLNKQRFMTDKKGDEFKERAEEREVWVQRRSSIESEMEALIIKTFK